MAALQVARVCYDILVHLSIETMDTPESFDPLALKCTAYRRCDVGLIVWGRTERFALAPVCPAANTAVRASLFVNSPHHFNSGLEKLVVARRAVTLQDSLGGTLGRIAIAPVSVAKVVETARKRHGSDWRCYVGERVLDVYELVDQVERWVVVVAVISKQVEERVLVAVADHPMQRRTLPRKKSVVVLVRSVRINCPNAVAVFDALISGDRFVNNVLLENVLVAPQIAVVIP